MKSLLILPLLVSCANVSSTRFSFTDASGSKLVVEMPKEVDAKALEITVDPKTGIFTLKAASWDSRNVATIKAQGGRESVVSGAIAEGIAIGTIKGLKGLP